MVILSASIMGQSTSDTVRIQCQYIPLRVKGVEGKSLDKKSSNLDPVSNGKDVMPEGLRPCQQ